MQRGLRDYAEHVKSRNEISDFMQIRDPRSEEEKINAADLQNLAQSEIKNCEKGN